MIFIRRASLAALRAAILAFGLSMGLQSGAAWAVSITTVAGSGDSSIYGEGGPATAAGMKGPHGVAFDSVGNLYIADRNRFRVRKVDALTGIITTVAGDGNFGITGDGGPATSATLRTPEALAVDGNNNLYIADSSGNLVRKVNLATGIITLVAGSHVPPSQLGDGGPAAEARLNSPNGVAVDPAGNVYISDWGNNRIRKVNASTQVITTVAGTGLTAFAGDGGLATQATIHAPNGVFLDANNNLYIVDTGNSRIRKVSGAGVISTVAGNGGRAFTGDGGLATDASLFDPIGVAVDRDGTIYIGDTGNDRIRRVSNGIITTYAGTGAPGFSGDGGPATAATFLSPRGVGVDSFGNVYVADFGNDRVRKIAAFTAQTITFPPIPAAVRLPGETLVVTATASSGLPVAFTSLTLSVCTVASTTASNAGSPAASL